ncbi:MAG: DUF1592 domain-containing protein [Verrucomicrobiota bacterium]
MRPFTITAFGSISLLVRTLFADVPQARMDEKHRAFFKDYCVECHNADKQKGKLRLDNVSFVLDSIENADRWQKILNQINSGEMPPEDTKQPEKLAKTDFLDSLSSTLVTARKSLGDVQGKITMRRLNRREYKNTIRDLLGIDLRVNDLPADGGAGTFDTVGSSLFMSSDQFDQYLALGRHALDENFVRSHAGGADAGILPPSPAYRLEPETVANPELEKLLKHYETTHKRFVRWQEGVDKAAAAPENQATLAELKKKDPRLNHPESTLLYYQADQFVGAPKSRDFQLGDTSAAAFGNQQYQNIAPYLQNYLSLPNRDQGAYLTLTEGYMRIDIAPPSPLASGRYKLRLRAGVVDGTPTERHFIEIGIPDEGQIKWNLTSVTSSHQITGSVGQPEILEVPIEVYASTPLRLSIRERQPGNYETAKAYYFAEKKKNGYGPDPSIWIDWIEIEGPVSSTDPKSALDPVIFANTTSASERDHARAIIDKFATRAFRGKEPSAAFIEKLTGLYDTRRNAGDSVEVALKDPLSVVLASPGFLYLQEPGEEKKPSHLSDLDLATRLSYFLWSAPPDDTLLALARNNTLSQPAVLAREVDRMISDAKSSEFVSGFVHQWLGMERLDFFQFDSKQFRDFDESAKVAARREVYETFAHLLRGNGSLTRLLKSDEIFINGLLATYYGIEGVSGDAFRSVKLPADSPRGGLLGMAAVLAMGSNGQTSSPVERGAWVLRKLLHDPPPPAPPNVPQLTRLEGKLLTTRERIAAHQEEPQCAQCHRKIDPIGFGLENFNAVGKWRSNETYVKAGVGKKTWPIDPAGAFYNGPAFKDYFELRDLIAAKPQQFGHGFTEALIEYALGRPFGFLDQDLAADIVKRAGERDFAVREFVHALVSSRAFQSK